MIWRNDRCVFLAPYNRPKTLSSKRPIRVEIKITFEACDLLALRGFIFPVRVFVSFPVSKDQFIRQMKYCDGAYHPRVTIKCLKNQMLLIIYFISSFFQIFHNAN